MTILTRIGDRICEAREALGLTQPELADRMHISRSNLAKWEIGLREIKAESLKMLADTLNVTTDWLLCLSDVSKPSIDDAAAAKRYHLTEESLVILKWLGKDKSGCFDLISQAQIQRKKPGFGEVVFEPHQVEFKLENQQIYCDRVLKILNLLLSDKSFMGLDLLEMIGKVLYSKVKYTSKFYGEWEGEDDEITFEQRELDDIYMMNVTRLVLELKRRVDEGKQEK